MRNTIKLLGLFLLLSGSIFFLDALVESFGRGEKWGLFFQVIESLFICLFWLVVYLTLNKSIFKRYASKYGVPLPSLFVTSIRLLLIAFTSLSILIFVFDKSIFSLAALAGLIGAGVTFALGELILDAFSGFILEAEGPLQVGDWIYLEPGKEGRVKEINWRTVVLETLDYTLIYIPYRFLTKGFSNFSRPQPAVWDEITLTLPFGMDVERAQRILGEALKTVPSIFERKINVFAREVTNLGIKYDIHYMIPEKHRWPEIRSEAILALTKQLKRFNLNPAQHLGNISFVKFDHELKELSPLAPVDLVKALPFSSSFSHDLLSEIAQALIPHQYKEGEVIIREGEKGTSLYIVGEGCVDVFIKYRQEEGSTGDWHIFSLGHKEYFGEMALLLNESRSATVRAAVDSLIYELDQEKFKDILHPYPEIVDKLIKEANLRKEHNHKQKEALAKMIHSEPPQPGGVFHHLKELFR